MRFVLEEWRADLAPSLAEAADDLRIDTHRDNAPMRGALEKLGFVPCGTVTVDDGTERIAYEKSSRISFAPQNKCREERTDDI